MNKTLLFTLFIVLSVFNLFGQKINNNLEDRIAEYLLEGKIDSTLINLYEEGYNNYKVSDPVKAIKYLKNIASIRDKEGELNKKYHRYVRIGQLYQQLGMYNFALEYLFEASGYFLKIDEEGPLAWLYSDIGNAYYALAQYDIAKPYYESGLELMIKLDDKYGQSVMHNNIALCKASNGDIEDSFKHLEIGLKLRQDVANIYAIYHSKFLIGKNYFLFQDYEKAESYLKDIWDNYKSDDIYPDEAKILRSSAGLGLFGVKSAQGDKVAAENYLDESIQLIEEVGDYFSLGSALAQKAQYYVFNNKETEALEIFEEIFNYALEHGFVDNAHFYSNWLVRLNYRQNNFEEAQKYFSIYSALTDSILTNRSSENLVKLHSVVQNHLKEVENIQLKEKDLYTSRLLIISTISLLVIIILIALIYIKDKKNLDKIRKLANASSEGIVVHDRGSIIDSNNQFKRMFFNADSKNRPTNIMDLAPQEEREKVQALLLANEKSILETHLINSKKDVIDVKISSRPYIYRSKEVRVAVIQDTTQFNDIVKSINQAKEKLRVLNSTKDRLFSIIAHDLKNPFNAIIGFTNLMKDSWREIDANEVDEMIAMINESSISAHTLLENLLDWARIQTENLSFEPVRVKVYDAISEAISLLSAQIKLKNISIFVDCSDDYFVFADSRMFSTILRNLLSNAIKYTNRNGEISFKVKQNASNTIISIDDDGIGMDQEQITNLFNFDLISSQLGTDKEKGTGLGLILCKELIDYHKGDIEVNSELNIGTIITITLPNKVS